MDDELLFAWADLEIRRHGEHYFVRYDVGSIATVMREDEISREEALQAARGADEAAALLQALRARLVAEGVDPYRSNLSQDRG